MYHIRALTASGTSSSSFADRAGGNHVSVLPVSRCGKTCGPTKWSPTIPAHILRLNCCWCVEWITPWGFSSAHWCWLWRLMMPSVPKSVSSVKSADETKKFSALSWIMSLELEGQQTWNPELLVNSKGKATVHAVCVLSRVRGCVKNNKGFWILWLGLLALLCNYNQLWQLTPSEGRLSDESLCSISGDWTNFQADRIEITISISSSLILCCPLQQKLVSLCLANWLPFLLLFWLLGSVYRAVA
jgi:hypothetical protein